MKKFILSVVVIFAASFVSTVVAQVEPPAGAGDTDLRDNNIRMRSTDLERVKRDADKANSSSPMNSEIDTKYPEIKEDFEGIQLSQAAIVKAYSTGESIDYKQIETASETINKNAKRLDSNLFSSKLDKKEKSKKDEEKKTESLRDLIVELDNAIGDFVSSPMFQNLRVVDPEVAKKAQMNLANIRELSEKVSKEAGKMK